MNNLFSSDKKKNNIRQLVMWHFIHKNDFFYPKHIILVKQHQNAPFYLNKTMLFWRLGLI